MPCALCLVERWPYRIAIVLGLLGIVVPPQLARVLLMLVVVALLADAALAFVHVGVEHHWWPSPLPECAAPHIGGGTIAERLASMPARPAKPCDRAVLPDPWPAGFHGGDEHDLRSGFAGLLAFFLAREARRPA